jgi:UDP-glucose 4-epimerase
VDYKELYSGKTILVTGGAGAIGSNLVQSLTDTNAKKIIVLDNLSSSCIWNLPAKKNVLLIKGDIRTDDDLRRVFHHKPTVIFHLAAFFANQNSVDYPLQCEDVNCRGIIKLLEYSIISGDVERFIYTNSEGGAYGLNSILPYKEEDVSLSLSSPYYISKMAAESYCYYYHLVYHLPVTILRLFNSYGPGEIPGSYRNVIPNFIYWALKKQALPLTGDKNISRDFIFVRDIVEYILRASLSPQAIATPINIATGKEILIYDLAELINRKTGNNAGTTILKSRSWDSRKKIIGNTDKCQQILNYQPKIDIETGLDLTIQWMKNNWKDIESTAAFPSGLNPALDV